ncbi:Cysteine-rich repeat secretory protein [Quillaja saponaria]|uniref:Cysteine-rich repeat secretory protein n=1 Tax=Quillaja saponaria TaxID=32244 RepID=A0AAD7QH20_QUISA|nr:Cysteine-rich repeat secretory protein [Quillaja saponaria]
MLRMKSTLLILILLSLCLPLQQSAYAILAHRCFSNETYNPSSIFASNLQELFNFHQILVPPTGFGKGSIGHGENQVFGLGQCRGDVPRTRCLNCISEAMFWLRWSCPISRGAIMWFDLCLFKYSNVNFYGQIDDTNNYIRRNATSISNPTVIFNQVNNLIFTLSFVASANPLFLATASARTDDSRTLYGLVECTRDLTPEDSIRCLNLVRVRLIPWGIAGAQFGYGSCYARYEIYSFFGQAPAAIYNMVSNNTHVLIDNQVV